MSAPFVPALDTFAGGQMTDLPAFTSQTLTGTELFEIVSGTPAATTADNAVNYSITSQLLASLLANVGMNQVVIKQGQNMTSGTAFPVPTNVGRIYIDKPTPEPTFITFGNASSQLVDVLVQDVAGTATAAGGDSISLTVTASGITNPSITQPYGGFWLRPVNSLNIWALGTA